MICPHCNKEIIRLSGNKIKIIELLKKEPGLNITQISEKINLSYQSTHNAISKLIVAGYIIYRKGDNIIGNPTQCFLKEVHI